VNETAVTVQGFTKRYGAFTAVDGISLTVRRGEIFGLLGPNGAGKTSTLECLEGIRRGDGGRLDVLGVDPARHPRRLRDLIGVQLQVGGLPADMTPREAMRFFAAYHDVAPRGDLLQRLGLGAKVDTPYRQLSTGQQRRLALALAVAHQPPVVLLDEPTAGLDVESRAELHALMAELRDAGTALILATHDMAEAEKMSDRIAILLRGKIVAEGTPREITAAGAGLTKVSVRTERGLLLAEGYEPPAVVSRAAQDEYAIYFSADPAPTVAALLARLKERDDRLIDLRVERPSLEERFLEITNGGAA